MFFIIGKPYSINDLKGFSNSQTSKNRSSYNIAVIDDDPFPIKNILGNHGFTIDELGDIQRIKQLARISHSS